MARASCLFTAFAVACGGSVAEPAPAPATSSNTAPVPGTNAPANVPAASGCAGACARMSECAAFDGAGCEASCSRELRRPAQAAAYGACIQALSCATLVEGRSMDFGPIGECYTKALAQP